MSDRVGQQLGNYRLLRLIGRGSIAEVYLGEHLHLNTQAAIKLLHTHFTSEASEQLLTEARTVARLVHPHIVRTLDFNVEDGTPFLIMEYAPNGTLRDRHPKGTQVPLDAIVSYVKQVADALHYIHQQKLIHRGVKPENMLLGRNNEVLLTEFSLAIIVHSTRSQPTMEAAGTVTYMAPEQLRGKPRPASDQYVLAVVVYEWLSGAPPFSGSIREIANQHLSAPPLPLHARVPSISAALEQVVLKALAKDPELRFANVQAFAMALEEAFHAESPGRALVAPASAHATERSQSRPSMRSLPTGTVTFLFTDIEGSTTRWEHHPQAMRTALARHDALLRQVITAHDGFVFKMVGDAVYAAFAVAADAVAAAVAVQRAVNAEAWGEVGPLRVRMALHTGAAQSRDDDYFGPTLNRVARLLSAGYGGQILLSAATQELARDALPAGMSLEDLGVHALKDLLRPEQVFHLSSPDLPGDFPALKTLEHRPHNLPMQPTPLIGREQEITSVCGLLRRPEVRLVTLTGPGGTGKTRLGLQVAAELSDHFADGVFFVNLAPLSDPALVMPTIAETLGMREGEGQFLREDLRQKHMLLLLDNFEQVVSAAEQVVNLLVACPRLKVMVTSREVLHVRAEHEFPVPPLPLPDLKSLPDLAALSHYAAVALFVQRAQATKPDFQLTTSNARAIVEICARLDGLPLAIELAAARVKLRPPQALLARLTPRLAVLTSGARDAPVRQRTLRNTIEWSYNLLDAAEQWLFRRLSVFVGGCTPEAAETVCAALDDGDEEGQLLDSIASLIDKSLLQQTEQEGKETRLQMLETIREYGLEALATSGELEAIQQEHALYYLALAETAEPELKGLEPGTWLERLEREHENLRTALYWWLEQGETGQSMETALRLGVALEQFWVIRGHYSEGRTFLERALAAREGAATAVQAKALGTAARLALNQSDMDRGEVLCEQSLALCRELGNTTGIALSLYQLAVVAWARNNPTLARSLTEEALALWQEVGDKKHVARALTWLAYIASQQGEYTRALALYEESLALRRELESKIDTADSLGQLAEVLYVSQSDPARVRSLLEEALALSRELGDKMGIAHSHRLAGQLALSQGNTTMARSFTQEALSLFREIGNREGTALSLSLLARVEARQGNHAAAHALYEESLTMAAKGMGEKGVIASCLEGLADLVAAQGEIVRAARLWGAAESLRETIGTPLPPIERDSHERSIAPVRTQLGERAFAAAWAQGRTMTPEQALGVQEPATIPTPTPTAPPSIASARPSPTYPDGLTAREVEVLRLLAQGLTDAQIADHLVISPRTVNNHITSIYSKIQVSSRAAATRYAMEHKLA